MRAIVYHGRTDIRLEDVGEPQPGPDEVKIKVEHNGICGTDLHEYYDGPIFIPTAPHPLTGAQLPQILGHEFSGTVVAVGKGVSQIPPKSKQSLLLAPRFGSRYARFSV